MTSDFLDILSEVAAINLLVHEVDRRIPCEFHVLKGEVDEAW